MVDLKTQTVRFVSQTSDEDYAPLKRLAIFRKNNKPLAEFNSSRPQFRSGSTTLHDFGEQRIGLMRRKDKSPRIRQRPRVYDIG